LLAVIYIRVSTEEQVKHGYSLSGQEDACLKKAGEIGAGTLIFKDEGITGAVLERPGLQAALDACKNPDCKYFIVYDPDRLSRKLAHQLMLADAIEKEGCKLEFVNFEWIDTPEGRLFYSLRGAIAEYEREKFKVRSRFGKLAKARKGLLTHNPGLYGYRYIPGKSTLEINEETAIIYNRMVEMALSGASPEEISHRLNEQKIPGPGGGKWYRQTIRRILRNYSYTGTLYLNKYLAEGVKTARVTGRSLSYRLRSREEWIAVSIPPLISTEKWETIQLLLNSKKGNRGGKVYSYPLSGLLYCGQCGSPMHGNNSRNPQGKVYRYYVCSKKYGQQDRKNLARCNMPALNCDQVEEVVWDKVSEWLKDPDAMVRDSQDESHIKAYEKEKGMLLNQLKDLTKQKERIFTAFRKGLIDLGELESVTIEINESRKNCENRLAEIEQKLAAGEQLEGNLMKLKELAKQVVSRLEFLDNEERSHVIRLLVKKITVFPGNEIVIEAAFGRIN